MLTLYFDPKLIDEVGEYLVCKACKARNNLDAKECIDCKKTEFTKHGKPVDFGEVELGTSKTVTLYTKNEWTFPIAIYALPISDPDLKIMNYPSVLKPSEKATVELLFAPPTSRRKRFNNVAFSFNVGIP